MSKAWIQTYTGKKIVLQDVNPEDIDIIDIAHALSQINRFTGHTTVPYSVAEHSVRASFVLAQGGLVFPEVYPQRVFERALLLHDAAEYVVGDVASPLKRLLTGYAEIEHAVQSAIATRFGVPMEVFSDLTIKRVDMAMLATEKRDLLGREPSVWDSLPEPLKRRIYPWQPREAANRFLERFEELFDR